MMMMWVCFLGLLKKVLDIGGCFGISGMAYLGIFSGQMTVYVCLLGLGGEEERSRGGGKGVFMCFQDRHCFFFSWLELLLLVINWYGYVLHGVRRCFSLTRFTYFSVAN